MQWCHVVTLRFCEPLAELGRIQIDTVDREAVTVYRNKWGRRGRVVLYMVKIPQFYASKRY